MLPDLRMNMMAVPHLRDLSGWQLGMAARDGRGGGQVSLEMEEIGVKGWALVAVVADPMAERLRHSLGCGCGWG